MPEVFVTLPHCSYTVHIEPGIIARSGAMIFESLNSDKLAIMADDKVLELHGDALISSLKAEFSAVFAFTQEEGEREKTLDRVKTYYDKLLTAGFDRSSSIMSFGGGVVGDTAGFVASTYFRGIPFVQFPTSLLSMVDASVGGKVGVNLPQGKNLIGAFHQPALVMIDPEVLTTLPEREISCGLAECIKHAIIRDADLFDWTLKNVSRILKRDIPTLTELIHRNVAIKAKVVEADETEKGVRAHLNFGHTFAHAIEAALGYEKIKHGEAVALGMLAATSISVERGLCSADVLSNLLKLIEAAKLPSKTELPSNTELVENMKKDKKAKDGIINLVLPTGLGSVDLFRDVSEIEMFRAWDSVRLKA